MKQFVPGQRGTGMCCCQEATTRASSPSPGSGKAWPIAPIRKCPHPPGVWLFPRDADSGSRSCLAKPPPKDESHPPGSPREGPEQDRAGSSHPHHSWVSSAGWDGLSLSPGRLWWMPGPG